MRQKTACVNCVRRKQKCDQLRPCTRCTDLGKDCEYVGVTLISPNQVKKEKRRRDPNLIYKKFKTVNQLFSKLNINFEDELVRFEQDIIVKKKKGNVGELETELVELFFKYINKVHNLILPTRITQILNSDDEYNLTLKYAICALSLKTYLYLNKLPPVELDENVFYNKATKLLTKLSTEPKIQLVQTIILLLKLEIGSGYMLRGSKSNVENVRLSQILNLHSYDTLENMSIVTFEDMERYLVGSFSIAVDLISTTYHNKPPLTKNLLPSPPDPRFSMKKNLELTNEENNIKVLMYLAKIFYYLTNHKFQLWAIHRKYYTEKITSSEALQLTNALYINLKAINSYDWFDLELYKIEDCLNLDNHPFLISYMSSYMQYKELIVLARCSQIYFLNKGDSEHTLYYIEYVYDAKRIAKLTYNELEIVKSKFKSETFKDCSELFYFIYFMHIYCLEVLRLPFKDDDSASAKDFVHNVRHEVDSLSRYWFLFNNEVKIHPFGFI